MCPRKTKYNFFVIPLLCSLRYGWQLSAFDAALGDERAEDRLAREQIRRRIELGQHTLYHMIRTRNTTKPI